MKYEFIFAYIYGMTSIVTSLKRTTQSDFAERTSVIFLCLHHHTEDQQQRKLTFFTFIRLYKVIFISCFTKLTREIRQIKISYLILSLF